MILLKNGTVIDYANNIQDVMDILIATRQKDNKKYLYSHWWKPNTNWSSDDEDSIL